MKREAYAAARTISPKLHAYFGRHREEALARGRTKLAPLPAEESIEAVIDAAFWASLRREEGYVPRISLAYVSPEEAQRGVVFERPLPLTPAALTRIAPAVERPGIHLGVWHDRGELCVWGATRNIPALGFVLEVAAPGLLVIKHHSGEEGRKFSNVAVLEGDEIKLIEGFSAGPPDSQTLIRSRLEFAVPGLGTKWVNSVVEIGVSMRAHGRGGLLLIVPAGSEDWRESILQPMTYAVSPPFQLLADLMRETGAAAERDGHREAIDVIVAGIGGLTAVDGAVVITDRYELLGFGAKIIRRKGYAPVEQVSASEPIKGATPTVVHPEQLGGTRHLSAAQFIQDQRDAVALVASQDGRFTIFGWSHTQQVVEAHRIDVLLL